MSLSAEFSCQDNYDPNSLSVDRARQLILGQLSPVEARERVALRSALGRVLAEDVIAPCNVPAHDNSAMDGYAFDGRDLLPQGLTTLRAVGSRQVYLAGMWLWGPGIFTSSAFMRARAVQTVLAGLDPGQVAPPTSPRC